MPQVTRRTLLQLGLGACGTTLASCSRKPELIESPVRSTHQPVGDAVIYATTCKLCPLECGMQARVKTGRLKKLEGLPSCAATRGALCAVGQAAVQTVYHPRRAVQGRVREAPGGNVANTKPEEAVAELKRQLGEIRGGQVLGIFPAATGHLHALAAELGWRTLVFDPGEPASLASAARICHGVDRVEYPIDQAEFILSFDADLVSRTPLARALGDWQRKRRSEDRKRARLVHVGPRFSVTAASADRWVAVRPGTEGVLALALAGAIAAARKHPVLAGALKAWTPERAAQACDVPLDLVQALVRRAADSRSAIAVPGTPLASYPHGPQLAQAIGLLNRLWEAPLAFGFAPPLADVTPPASASVRSLVQAIREAAATVIVDLDLLTLCPEVRAALKQPTAYLTTREDLTASQADIVVPLQTFLESWDDAFSTASGTASVVQPVVQPHAGFGAGDVLLELLRQKNESAARTYHDYLRRRWAKLCPKTETFEHFWERVCTSGQWQDPKPRPVRPSLPALDGLVPEMSPMKPQGDGLYLYVYPAPLTGESRRADLPWLQERYDVLTTVAWSSPLELHPETAKSLGLADGDVVSFSVGQTVRRAPVVLYPGIRRDTAGMPLGLPDSLEFRTVLSGKFNDSGDPILNSRQITLEKVGSRPLARAAGTTDDQGRGLAILHRSPS